MKIKEVGKKKLGLYCMYDMSGMLYLTDDEKDVDGLKPTIMQLGVNFGIYKVVDGPGYIASAYQNNSNEATWQNTGEVTPDFDSQFFYVGEV